jgi:hypothetical protein
LICKALREHVKHAVHTASYYWFAGFDPVAILLSHNL